MKHGGDMMCYSKNLHFLKSGKLSSRILGHFLAISAKEVHIRFLISMKEAVGDYQKNQ